ncbi:hypothetical protein BH20VER3_BH20VER3_17090 [soil metagenome]
MRALGQLGKAERELLDQALRSAREEHVLAPKTHPVTLVMEALFALLSKEEVAPPVSMTPPIQRVHMLPEPTEFPLHERLRQISRVRRLLFAGAH